MAQSEEIKGLSYSRTRLYLIHVLDCFISKSVRWTSTNQHRRFMDVVEEGGYVVLREENLPIGVWVQGFFANLCILNLLITENRGSRGPSTRSRRCPPTSRLYTSRARVLFLGESEPPSSSPKRFIQTSLAFTQRGNIWGRNGREAGFKVEPQIRELIEVGG